MNTQTASEPIRQASRLPQGVSIELRHPAFDFAKDRKYWFDGDPLLTHFMHALSMHFPEGERFFVKSVIHYRDQIQDPELKKQVSAFAGQEGIHSAEHHHYNEQAVGEKTAARSEKVGGFLLGFSRFGPAKMRLAITVALEHMTAIMADELFGNAAVQRDMDPEHRKLWLWHAAEETEHKAVAFDVYQMVKGGALRRSVALVVSTFFLFLATGILTVVFLWRDGEFFKFRNLKSIGKFFFKYKFLVNIVPAWFSFFRPGFHPWQHDNSAQLFAWKQQYAVA